MSPSLHYQNCRYWVAYVGSFVTLVVAARWFRNIGKSNKGIWAPLWTFRIILNGGIMASTVVH